MKLTICRINFNLLLAQSSKTARVSSWYRLPNFSINKQEVKCTVQFPREHDELNKSETVGFGADLHYVHVLMYTHTYLFCLFVVSLSVEACHC